MILLEIFLAIWLIPFIVFLIIAIRDRHDPKAGITWAMLMFSAIPGGGLLLAIFLIYLIVLTRPQK